MIFRSTFGPRLAWTALAVLGFVGALAQAADRQPMLGHIPRAAGNLTPISRLASTNQLNLAICLPLRHTNELDQLLEEIYDPASPNFRHYLSAEEFARRFGPSAEDYAALAAFCRSNGLAVTATHPNRTILDVAAPASAVEHAFHTTLRVYQHPTENRRFYAPEREPSLDLAIPVLRVQGLDDFTHPHALLKHAPAGVSRPVRPASGSGTDGSFLGNDFRLAYAPGVTLTGNGQTLGLVEFDGYYASDITAYENLANLPAVTLQNVLLGGFNGKPGSGNEEVALDIQMAIAMAPGLQKIMVYEITNTGSSYSVLNRIATDNAAKQISSSWLGGSDSSATDQIFKQYAAQGQSFFQAAGDSGAFQAGSDAPADDPYITVVGGTTLSTTDGAWSGETVWNDGQGDTTGGGYSATYGLPSWQSGVTMAFNGGSTSHRNLPDVAMIADNAFSISDNGTNQQLVGTSIAAPLWAAFTALINQQAAINGQPNIGFLNPALYAIGKSAGYLNAFHDTSSGGNATGQANGFYAVAGYDLCTGWGTPTGINTINQLLEAAHGQAQHFTWSAIHDTVATNAAFAVTLAAQTISNTVATSFTGAVSLSAVQVQTNSPFERDFESGDLSDWTYEGGPYTYQIDTTTGAAGTKQSLTLIGGNGGAYDGLAHTLPSLKPDWVVFYVKTATTNAGGAYFVAGQAAYRSNSVFHFRMDGTNSMGVSDAMGLTDGAGNFYSTSYRANQWYKISLRLDWTSKTVAYYVNDSLVMGNIPFCNTALTSLEVINLYNFDSTQAWWDQITLLQSSSTPVVITPSASGTFTRGTWSGSVTLTQGGTNLMLTATDSAGHTGTSNPFDAGGASGGGTNSTSATNQAPRIKGTYTGLFFQSNAVAQQSSGFFSLNATASGSFSGTLQNGGTRYPLSGKFDTNTGHATVTNRPHSLTPLLVDLQLDMTQGTDRLSGMVSNSLWTSQLAGDRATFNAKTNPAPQAGQYTLIIPGSPGSTTEPAGDGFGVVTIYSSGQIRFAGSLSDGTKISQTTLLSKYGQWPLYVSLYSGKGSILSWLTVTNPPEGGLGGDLVWVKPLSSAKLYPGGFTLEPAVFGSSYSPPGTNKVITLTDAEVVLTDGNLTNDIAGQFTLGAKSRVTTTNKLTLSFTQSSGLFKGNLRTADHPKSISFSGVVLQNQTNGSGYFLGTNQSGRIVLQGD